MGGKDMAGRLKIVLAVFIFAYVFTSSVSEAEVFNVIRSVFNAVSDASPAGSPHPNNAPKSACAEKPERLRIPEPEEIKRRRSRKKKASGFRRRKKPFKYIKTVTENPDDKEPENNKKLRSASSEKGAGTKTRNDKITEVPNKVSEYENAMKFINIIPRQINPAYKKAPSHFTRNGKLPFPELIIFILSIAAGGKSKGSTAGQAHFSEMLAAAAYGRMPKRYTAARLPKRAVK